MDSPPRYVPELAFPPYAYISGQHPHPVRDPKGHSYGQPEVTLPTPQRQQILGNSQFLFGVDLFNHGYYWEAHEVWEGLWHACGRRGELADFLKGLIKLAAAGFKAREGNPVGVIRHAERAQELFAQSENHRLAEWATTLRENPPSNPTPTTAGHPVLGVRLTIEDFVVP
ncbi:MAG: DUF309 domain-containing protein [Planctomycetaceae bacterium]|nr:DUF309 domain-containing protein [Planctomycetaceae bacterium]